MVAMCRMTWNACTTLAEDHLPHANDDACCQAHTANCIATTSQAKSDENQVSFLEIEQAVA